VKPDQDHIIKVDKSSLSQAALIRLNKASLLGVLPPCCGFSVEVRASMLIKTGAQPIRVNVGSDYFRYSIAKNPLLYSGSRDGQFRWQSEAGDIRERKYHVFETEGVDGADIDVFRFLNAQGIEPTSQLSGTLKVVGNACNAARRSYILGKHSCKFDRQRLSLATAWTSEHDAIAFRFISFPLTRVVAQLFGCS
jgi:hypothetical protein